MDVAEGLPAGLADVPAGPELAAVLAGIDRSRVGAGELHDLCAARLRLLARVQAQLLADVWETGRAVGQPAGSLIRSRTRRRGTRPTRPDTVVARLGRPL